MGAESVRELQRGWRAAVLPRLRGTVLDVGAGAGAASEHLRAEVTWLALEPRRSARRALETAVARRTGSRLLAVPAERIPLPDGSVDAAVCSSVLCSVMDPAVVLAEVRRVLRPGGRVVFFEHVVAAPGTWARAVQALCRPFTRALDAGCDPTRDTAAAIGAAGFRAVDLGERSGSAGLGASVPLILGEAIR